jgi:polysaccharide export outer membrane protein
MQKHSYSLLSVVVFAILTQGCVATSGWTPSSGPSRGVIEGGTAPANTSIHLVDITGNTVQYLMASLRMDSFAQQFPANLTSSHLVGAGDIVEVSIWEAPPATLFGAASTSSLGSTSATQATVFPEEMVAADGTIQIPFAGAITAAGRSPEQIQNSIVQKLSGKAHQPQVMVRLKSNETSNVTVVGDVAQSKQVPLTAKGEHLLDALAAAGGPRDPIDKVTVQFSRGSQMSNMPMERVVQEPEQNIPLAPGDVITVVHQPLSFTALGATGKNAEIDFEAKGISLTQALARAGGSMDNRADVHGLFVFRFEDPQAVPANEKLPRTPDGKIPVVYRLNLDDPAAFLVAQKFPMKNKDVLYISDAPATELQKFLSILTSSVYSVDRLVNLGN